MRSSSLYTVCGLLLMMGALAANRLLPTGEAMRLARLDANAFPRRAGEWRNVSDLPLPAYVPSKLPTASVIDRVYTDSRGEAVELALVSATNTDDAHDPELCLRGWGWTLETPQLRALDGLVMRSARAHQNGQEMEVLFWWDMPDAPTPRLRTRLQKFRLETQGHGTILVRLTTPATPHSDAVLRGFARQILPALAAWKQAGENQAEDKR